MYKNKTETEKLREIVLRQDTMAFKVDIPNDLEEQEVYWMKLTKKELTSQIMGYLLLLKGHIKRESSEKESKDIAISNIEKLRNRLDQIHYEVNDLMKFNHTLMNVSELEEHKFILRLINRYLFSIRAIVRNHEGVYDK